VTPVLLFWYIVAFFGALLAIGFASIAWMMLVAWLLGGPLSRASSATKRNLADRKNVN
jgi:hypothetical protein